MDWTAFFSTLLAKTATELAPVLFELVSVAVALVVARVAIVLKRRLGLEIEARHREALHSALMTGMKSAIAAGLGRDAAIDLAVNYARASVPDAIAQLKPASGVLQDIAHAKWDDVNFYRPQG